MIKKIMKGVALVAVALTVGGTILKGAELDDTIWVYTIDGSTTASPSCNSALPGTCAREYNTFPGTENPNLDSPTGNVLSGQRTF